MTTTPSAKGYWEKGGSPHSTNMEDEPKAIEVNGIAQDTHIEEHNWEEKLDSEKMEQWTYMGHGEWTPPDSNSTVVNPHENQSDNWTPTWEPDWIQKWLAQADVDIHKHHQVIEKGYPNRWGARIPVDSKWDLHEFEKLLGNYEDKEVVEWMKYGWPTGRLPTLKDPELARKNHRGASDYPEALSKYVDKELKKGAVMGPYAKIPFHKKVGISPLSTRPKRELSDR